MQSHTQQHPSSKRNYSLMLINMDKKVHQTYKRLAAQNHHKLQSKTQSNNIPNSSSIQTSNPSITPSQIVPSQSSRRSAFETYLLLKNQSSYPFGLSEERFKWQNLHSKNIPINPDDHKNQLHKVPVKHSLDGGFEQFYNANTNKKYSRNKSTGNFYLNKLYGEHSQRTTNPLYVKHNTKVSEYQLSKGIKCDFTDVYGGRIKRQNSDGNIQSLIDKTPKDIPLKGKKRNQRLSYSQNGTLNLFCEDYHMKSPEVNYGKKRMHFNDVIFKSKVHIG